MSCDSSEIKKSKNQNSYNFICKNWFMICLSFINIFYLWMWYYVFIYVKFDYNLYDVINIFYLWNMILCPYLCENWFMMCTSIFKYILCVRCDFMSSSLQKNYLLSILVLSVIKWMWNVMSCLYLLFAWCIYDYVLLFQWIKCVIKCNCADIWTSSFNHYALVFVLY